MAQVLGNFLQTNQVLIREADLLTDTQLITFTPDEAATLYKNINRLSSTQNKTNMLRLIHGEIYYGERLKKFKMSEIETCIKCFEKETIKDCMTINDNDLTK
jgi:hypothetical protein